MQRTYTFADKAASELGRTNIVEHLQDAGFTIEGDRILHNGAKLGEIKSKGTKRTGHSLTVSIDFRTFQEGVIEDTDIAARGAGGQVPGRSPD